MAEKAEKVIKEKIVKAEELVKAELVIVREGIHVIATSKGVAEFKDGFAEIKKELADELKALGIIK